MRKKTLKFTIAVSAVLMAVLVSLPAGCRAQHKEQAPPSARSFDDIQMWIDVFESPKRDESQKPDEVVANMDLKPGDIVADIGAGTGYFTRRFARAVGPEGKALGLDMENSMVEYMKEDAGKLNLKNYIVRTVRTDDPELRKNSVDVIFLCNTYHHIENREEYFNRIKDSLKLDGRVVIVDYFKKPLPVGPPSVEHKLAKNTVIDEMRKTGYRLTQDKDFLPHQYYLEFKL